ncbi:hypothetical protein [Natronolimnobius baerhuensis]|uniref:Uncharacterized protein n=1 Tax=Natronolimnobius baerhuensis TaxID=253108 RepID=A0A202E7V1_9EURY|nr:hypothetical protein [Natronolimnobius baerhuensis]OVE84333.1 hypothetical protein B2G88_07920 [Natronolimnobius baerhuensis]
MSEFVRASRLYHVSSRTPIAHPAHQASDDDVRRSLEEREVRADGGTASSEQHVPVRIDGARVPAFQIDRIDDDVIVHVEVASAVSEGFDFTGIWRCKRATIETPGIQFTATITACSVEHGIAAIRLTDRETLESNGGSR